MVRETSYFGEDNNNSKNAQFLLGSPMSLCTAVLSAGPGLCPESAWPQELQPSPLSLTCPMAPAPISTQQQRVDVCGCIQRKGLPWPLLRFLRFLFPNPHKHGGSPLSLGPLHQALVCLQDAPGNSTGGQV